MVKVALDNAWTIEDELGEEDEDYEFYPLPRPDGRENRVRVKNK